MKKKYILIVLILVIITSLVVLYFTTRDENTTVKNNDIDVNIELDSTIIEESKKDDSVDYVEFDDDDYFIGYEEDVKKQNTETVEETEFDVEKSDNKSVNNETPIDNYKIIDIDKEIKEGKIFVDKDNKEFVVQISDSIDETEYVKH